MYTCECKYIYTCIHAYMYVYIDVYIYIYVKGHIYKYIHIKLCCQTLGCFQILANLSAVFNICLHITF